MAGNQQKNVLQHLRQLEPGVNKLNRRDFAGPESSTRRMHLPCEAARPISSEVRFDMGFAGGPPQRVLSNADKAYDSGSGGGLAQAVSPGIDLRCDYLAPVGWAVSDGYGIAATPSAHTRSSPGRNADFPKGKFPSLRTDLSMLEDFTMRIATFLNLIAAAALGMFLLSVRGHADETCMSPYMPKITGHEDFIYVWTLGVEGMGDGRDKLVTVDVRPESATYGRVIHSVSLPGRNEAHHGGFTDDRRHLWVSGLDTSNIFIFDVRSDPAKPKLVKTIGDFVKDSGGVVGPHTIYALPGRVIISGLSNDKDHGGRTALVEYTNEGDHVVTHWMPTTEDPRGAEIEQLADGYGYDVRVLPRKNAVLTSSFTGWSNYMMDFGQMLKDAEAMKRFGQTVTLWNLHTRQPRKVFHVPGAPLEIRWALGPKHNYAFTSTALTSKLWLIYEDENSEWRAKEISDIGDPAKIPLPVDISLSSDDSTLFVDSFMDGTVRVFDVSDPHHPQQIHQQVIGKQVNMVSQSWDGKRVYFTSSLLANWDKKGADNEQFLKGFDWDGDQLTHRFTIDFTKEELGRPHIMRFGAETL